jgi:hypothetical protein
MKRNFEEELKNAVLYQDRLELAMDPATPSWVLETFVEYDDSYPIIEAALNNANLTQSFLTKEILDRVDKNKLEYNGKKYWLDLSNFAKEQQDRITLALDPNCPFWLLEMFITKDVEVDVVRTALDHPSITTVLTEIGHKRLITMEPLPESTLCPIPWTHLEVSQNGDMRVCCMCIHEPYGILKNDDGSVANIKDTPIEAARNTSLIKELRKSMVNGEQHSMCNQCWDAEKLGLKSKRKAMLATYGKDDEDWKLVDADGSIDTNTYPIKYMDLRFGNLCNLKCRSCGPTDSSLWADDYLALTNSESTELKNISGKIYKIEKVGHKAEFTIGEDDFFWYEKDKFWQEFTENAHNIDRLYFTGGEPSINKPHYKLLDYLIGNGYSKNIELEYNSNMVAIPDRLYEQWENFKKVTIGCSIDGIHAMAEYLRPPAEWKDLEPNLDRMGYSKSRIVKGSIATTVSVYNILHLIDMAEWLLEKKYTNIGQHMNIHMLWGPEYMNVQVLPQEVKDQITARYHEWFADLEQRVGGATSIFYKRTFTGILNHMNYKDLSHMLPELILRTVNLDKLRNQDIYNVIPWLIQVVNFEK